MASKERRARAQEERLVDGDERRWRMIIVEICEEHELTQQEQALVRRIETALAISLPPYRQPRWSHIYVTHPSKVVVLVAKPLCVGHRRLRIVVAFDPEDAGAEKPAVMFLGHESELAGEADGAFFRNMSPFTGAKGTKAAKEPNATKENRT